MGSAWDSSPARIYSYAASGPPCCLPAVFLAGLPEQKDWDSIKVLQCRPRLGQGHGGLFSKAA